MSLIVEVYVGSHLNKERRILVSEGVLHNISNLADISDYEGVIIEAGKDSLNIPPLTKEISIQGHDRNQSVWKLISKMAEEFSHEK